MTSRFRQFLIVGRGGKFAVFLTPGDCPQKFVICVFWAGDLAGDDDGAGGVFALVIDFVNVDAAGHDLAIDIFAIPEQDIHGIISGSRLKGWRRGAAQIVDGSFDGQLLRIVEFKTRFVIGAVSVGRDDARGHARDRDRSDRHTSP